MPKKLALLLLLALGVTLFLVSACGGGAAQPAAQAANAAAGKAIFEQNCNACHPGGGQGAGPALKGRSLTIDRIQGQVRKGGGGMPAFPASKISDQQLSDLAAYVQSLK